MADLPRGAVLFGSMALGTSMIAFFVARLIRLVRVAVEDSATGGEPADLSRLRLRLFLLLLGVVAGSWFLTYGALSLLLGV